MNERKIRMKDLYLNCRQDTFHHSSLGLYLINHSLIVEWKINERSPECTRAKERKKWKKARVLSYYYQVILCFPIIWMLRNEISKPQTLGFIILCFPQFLFNSLNKSLNQKWKVKISPTIIKIKKRKLFYEKWSPFQQ